MADRPRRPTPRATALEAAIVEADEIKKHRPPYNIALMTDHREVWFTSTDLSARSLYPSGACPVGPVMSAATSMVR